MADYLTDWDKDVENPAVDRMELYNKLLTHFNEQGQTDGEQCWRLVVICLILSDLQLKNKNKYTHHKNKSLINLMNFL